MIYRSESHGLTKWYEGEGQANRAVVLECGKVRLARLGEIPLGIALEVQGAAVLVQLSGYCLWEVSEPIRAGDLLSADEGCAAAVTLNEFIFAQSLENTLEGKAMVLIIRAGYAAIEDDWDVVKLFFSFPLQRQHRRYRGISLKNPRPDLTRSEIKAAGQYAVDEQLIKNEAGETANAVFAGALKRYEVSDILKKG